MNYHNEHEPKTAAWLRCLIEDGLLPPGHVDERSIEEYLCMRDGKTGYPNPEYLLWLMGFPASWMRSQERATQSAHRSQ